MNLKTLTKENKNGKYNVYFIGNVFTNPHTLELFYCVKVGKTKNYKNRKQQYLTHVPFLFEIDLRKITEKRIDDVESLYHGLLQCCGKRFSATEWYQVNREDYLEMCEKGFTFFEDRFN